MDGSQSDGICWLPRKQYITDPEGVDRRVFSLPTTADVAIQLAEMLQLSVEPDSTNFLLLCRLHGDAARADKGIGAGGVSVHAVYLDIGGSLHPEHCRLTTSREVVAFFPPYVKASGLTKEECDYQKRELFHHLYCLLLAPLKDHLRSKQPINIRGMDGVVLRTGFVALCALLCDIPEAAKLTNVLNGRCTVCQVEEKGRGLDAGGHECDLGQSMRTFAHTEAIAAEARGILDEGGHGSKGKANAVLRDAGIGG
jgi:hypothetical protein